MLSLGGGGADFNINVYTIVEDISVVGGSVYVYIEKGSIERYCTHRRWGDHSVEHIHRRAIEI